MEMLKQIIDAIIALILKIFDIETGKDAEEEAE